MLNSFKNYFFLLFFCFIIFFFTSTPVSAQQLSQRWVCLQSDWCSSQSSGCSNNGVTVHRARLSAKTDAKLLPNTDTYIVECLSTAKGQVCTTGNPNTDTQIYGTDNTVSLKTTDNYRFQGIFISDGVTPATNPEKSNVSGDINPVEWQSASNGNARKFFGLNYFDPTSANTAMGAGAEQQGTFSFDTQSNLSSCISISWDPYGRVFDSQTLEPIPNASVTLLKKRQDGSYSQLLSSELLGGAINNPYTTNEDGVFSFVIPDGSYQLSVAQQSYSFPSNGSLLNQGYVKAYTELYPQQTGSEIIQKGSITHRDIPLDPKGSGIQYPIKLVEYSHYLDKARNKIILEGLVSHPLSKIRFYSEKTAEPSQALTRYKLLKEIQTDKYGKFNTEIDQSLFEPTEVFGDIELEKVDLTKNITLKEQPFIQKVEAAQPSISIIRFKPILNSIRGYAYDAKKNSVVNANAAVYLTYASKPYYQVKTDSKGYYEIPSERLPNSPFTIQYSTVLGGAVNSDTSTFLAQNSTYLSENKINLNTNKASSSAKSKNIFEAGKLLTSTNSGTKTFPVVKEGLNAAGSSTNQHASVNEKSQNNSRLLIIVAILLFLIGGAGGLLGFYLLKKRQSLNNPF